VSDGSIGAVPKRVTWLKWGGIVLFLLWLFYTLTAYYVVNKPLDALLGAELAQQADSWRFTLSLSSLLRTLLDLATAVWLAWIALGVGAQLLSLISKRHGLDATAVLYSLGLGFGALGLLILLLGLIGLLQSAVFTVISVALTLLTTRAGLRLVRHNFPPRPSRVVTLYLIPALGLALTVALTPPTSWDGLFYHLTGPKLYLQAGGIQPGIDIPHLNFPSLFEMLFTMAMGLRGAVSAKLLHYLFNLMLAGLVYQIARDHLKVKNGWSAVLFLYATPMVLALSGWAYNDLALAFYQVGAVLAILEWRRERQSSMLVLSGIFCGLAMGLKYTSFVAPLFLIGVVIWDRRSHLANGIRHLSQLVLPAALVAAPWYVKNLLFTGNPFYPFLFGGRFWDSFRSVAYSGADTGLGFDPIGLIRLPHDLTLGLGDASQDGPTGPLFLAFLPLLLFFALRRKRIIPASMGILLTFGLVQYLFWTMGVIFSAGLWQSRLLLPALVALAPAMAWILDHLAHLDHPQFSLRRFVQLVVGLVLALGLLGQSLSWLSKNPLAYLIGDESRGQLLARHLGLHYLVMEEMNQMLPLDAVVAFLWEPRSYYCESKCRPDSILDSYARSEHLHEDAAGIAAHWRSEGISHVLLHEAGLQFLLSAGMHWVVPQDLASLQELRAGHLIPVANWQDVYVLYRLKT
jgi:hypothetical protein